MTESTIDIDRAMQGIDCEVITWTKCSERMPPDDLDIIIVDPWSDMKRLRSGRTINKLCIDDPQYKSQIIGHKWTKYTPEAWALLNHKTD